MSGERHGANVSQTIEVIRWAARAGFADLATLHTWRTWVFGWLVRVLTQVLFFALYGELVGSETVMRYLLVGACVSIAMVEATTVMHSTSGERRSGTLPLIVASPTSAATVFFGRGLQWVASATTSATIALAVLVPAFRVPVSPPAFLVAVLLLALVATATYCFGLVLAGLVLRWMGLRPLLGSATWLCLSILAGVYFPASAFPDWLSTASRLLPGTNALLAIRSLFGQETAPGVALLATAEAAVALGWLAVAALCTGRLIDRCRLDGSLEFAD